MSRTRFEKWSFRKTYICFSSIPTSHTSATTFGCCHVQANVANWYSAVADFTHKHRCGLTKRDFPGVLSGVWRKYSTDSAKGGFKGCGIHPFDSSVIQPEALRYSEPFSSSLNANHSTFSSTQPLSPSVPSTSSQPSSSSVPSTSSQPSSSSDHHLIANHHCMYHVSYVPAIHFYNFHCQVSIEWK